MPSFDPLFLAVWHACIKQERKWCPARLKHDRIAISKDALLVAEMAPWLVVCAASFNDATAARLCFRPLVPLMKQVLQRMQASLLEAPTHEAKVHVPVSLKHVSLPR
jgi:hypothetical protein